MLLNNLDFYQAVNEWHQVCSIVCAMGINRKHFSFQTLHLILEGLLNLYAVCHVIDVMRFR
jgi:hypothetical protein